jgi:surface carbohydrate biosynthesis protein (TIGR04326 family)
MNVLILLSSHERSLVQAKEKIKRTAGVKKYYLCPINFDLEDTVRDLQGFIRSSTKAECEAVPFSRLLLEHSLKVKDDYIAFVSRLGEQYVPPGVKLKEYFRYHSQKFSLWWLSLVYEKSPGKTDTFLHFVKISLIVELAGKKVCDEIWLSCAGTNAKYFDVLSSARQLKVSAIGPRTASTGFLKTVVLLGREGLRVAGHLMFLKQVRARLHGFGPRKRPGFPDGCRRFAVTMFPFFDPQKFAEKKFYSKAYGPLQDGLDDDKGHPYAWLAMPIKIEPYTAQDSTRLVKEAKEFDPKFFSVDEWIGWRDIVRIGWDFLCTKARFLKIAHRMPDLTSCTLSQNVEVKLWPIIREDFISSFAGKVLIVNLHYLRTFLNIARSLPKDSTVIHFAEMHNWERCLQIACRLRGDIKVVALQHAHVPQLLLNYFDHPDDLKSEDLVESVPQPAFLGSVGPVIQNYFLKQGWPREKLFIVGGFRFQSLLQEEPFVRPDRQNPYLVAAFSICYNENLEMLKMLQKAFFDRDMKIRVFIKSHPAESVEKMARKEDIILNRDVFVFTDEPLEKLMPRASAMFACSTSAIFYAMACRRPVIIPLLYDAIDLCPLTNLYEHGTRIENHQELKKTMGDVLQGRYNQNHFEEFYQQLIREYLCLDKDVRQPFNKLKVFLNK